MPSFQPGEAFDKERKRAEALRNARQLVAEQRKKLKSKNQKIERQGKALGDARQRIKQQRKALETKDQKIKEQAEALKRSRRRKRMLQKNSLGQHTRAVHGLHRRLHALGFEERALGDLRHLVADDSRPLLKKLAAWELCVWYAGQRSEEGARRCLALLPAASQDERDADYLRRAAILEAECQEVLGNVEAARLAVSRALALGPHADLFFANANLEASAPAKIGWVNKALQLHGISEITFDASATQSLLDSLRSGQDKEDQAETSADPRVSVIMPVYNAENVIRTALDSVLSQTWTNLEVLVVDDCSTDATVTIVEDRAGGDPRIRLIRAESNGGTYVARNLGLRAATGALVTCHDADDWSHPEKIEKQVRHLLSNPEVVGNTSEQTRCTSDLVFTRRESRPFLLSSNMSSFMFRREPMMEAVGYWDCVRFAADNEFIHRTLKVFGEESVVQVPTGPLSFLRQSSGSLTRAGAFGVYGHRMGSRKEYFEGFTHYHDTAENLRYTFPQGNRPFAVPEPMWPIREAKEDERRHFDVILVSDFRPSDDSASSNVEEIKAQKRTGIRTGLIQLSRYDLDHRTGINQEVRELLDGDRAQMLVYGEKVSCDALILRGPASLQEWQRFVPEVETANVHVIVDEAPITRYGNQDALAYTIGRCEKHLREHFGRGGVWHPTDPLVRETLLQHHAEELTEITLANEDWSSILDVDAWRRESRPPRRQKPRIGTRSGDNDGRRPDILGELLAIFPDAGDYEVHVLEGSDVPGKALGDLPSSWHAVRFGEVHPKDFLATLDVFVDLARPHPVEGFGPSVIEAMAAGVPVILSHDHRELFREAAIYTTPSELKKNIDQLMADDDYYESQVRIARDYVEQHFGYASHVTRLEKLLG